MDIFAFGDLNYWAILVAVLAWQGLGFAWYGLLSKPWLAAARLRAKDLAAMKGTPRQWYPYVVSILASGAAVLVLALLIQALAIETLVNGLWLGWLLAGSFVLAALALNYAFEGRSLKLWLINGGYTLISYGLAGVILTVWT